MNQPRIVIVGAGLAGLACARSLQQARHTCLLLESGAEVGGRIRTDRVEGFQLDRGFQVLLEAYPEARRSLDYRRLKLRRFAPGALVRFDGRFHRLADPWRSPLKALGGLFSPIGSLADKVAIARLRRRLQRRELEDIFADVEITTLQALGQAGFSAAMVERFFRPFLAGVFLDPDLETSSRMFEFVFKMFSAGRTSLPAVGMQAIPQQLAAGLQPGTVRLDCRVERRGTSAVHLGSGERIDADILVVATDGREAQRLVPALPAVDFQTTTCLYFDAPSPPIRGPWLVLNGEGQGPINNLCVNSEVAREYAPRGRSLVAVTVLDRRHWQTDVESPVRSQLAAWFGDPVESWRLLRTYVIDRALPRQSPGLLEPAQRPVTIDSSLYVCGDHRDQGSIQGALLSGRRTAEAILSTLD